MSDGRATNGVDKRIGLRLRSRRIEIGMSQVELGEMLGVSFQQVQKYEKGTNRIAASRLFEICAVTKTPISYFYQPPSREAGRDRAENGAVDAMLLTPEGRRLVHLFSMIKSEKVRRRLLGLAEAVVANDD